MSLDFVNISKSKEVYTLAKYWVLKATSISLSQVIFPPSEFMPQKKRDPHKHLPILVKSGNDFVQQFFIPAKSFNCTNFVHTDRANQGF